MRCRKPPRDLVGRLQLVNTEALVGRYCVHRVKPVSLAASRAFIFDIIDLRQEVFIRGRALICELDAMRIRLWRGSWRRTRSCLASRARQIVSAPHRCNRSPSGRILGWFSVLEPSLQRPAKEVANSTGATAFSVASCSLSVVGKMGESSYTPTCL